MARNKNKSAGKAQAKTKPAKAKQAKAPAKDTTAGGPTTWWESAVQFLREVKTELKKVNWPNKKQTISSTGVVLALVAIVSVFLGLVDMLLARVVRIVIG